MKTTNSVFLRTLFFISLISLPVLPLNAQNVPGTFDPSHADQTVLNREGSLFSVKLVPGKNIEFLVTGKKEADFDFSDGELTVRRLKPRPGKLLIVKKANGHFSLNDALESNEPTELEVTTKHKGKSEIFYL